jgi:hypothetical protein
MPSSFNRSSIGSSMALHQNNSSTNHHMPSVPKPSKPGAFGIDLRDDHLTLITTGLVNAETLDTEIGAFYRRYPAHTIRGTGSSLSFTVRPPIAKSSLILEIQEIHQRRESAFAYSVTVNGTACYFRTYAEKGAGPNHWFLALPDTSIQATEVTVTITSAGASPFSLGQMWLYGDFFTTIDPQEQVYRPLMLMGNFAKPGPGEPPMRSFGPFGSFIKNDYANLPKAATQKNLTDYLTQSATAGQSLQFLLNGPTWGGALSGPDGKGGYFNDIRYSVLSYDAGHDIFVPSFPNMWGSTFWATFRDPWLNHVLDRRFQDGLQGHTQVIDRLKAQGLDPQPYFLREMGPPLGEITDATIAAAAREGITLDPKTGLDAKARRWLYRDAVRLWQEMAISHAAAIPRDSIVVDRGTVRIPAAQLSENQYSHTIFKSEAPMQDARWFGGQTGMVPGFWSTGELFWDRFDEYDYVKANGKLVHGNLEATILKNDCSPLRNLYASGFQYACFLNDSPEFTEFIRRADACDDLPALSPIHHERVVFSVPIGLQGTMGRVDQVLDHVNLMIQRQSHENADVTTTAKLLVRDVSLPGRITWRVSDGGEPFTAGLRLRVNGRITPGSGNAVEVWTGATMDTLTLQTVLSEAHLPCPDHWTPFMTSISDLDLGTHMVGQQQWIVRLVVLAQYATDAVFLIDAQVTSQWSQVSGPMNVNPWTMRQQRTLQLWIQDRVVAHRLMDRYANEGGDPSILAKAQELATNLLYGSVQRLLVGELSQILPARYVVRGHGRLGRHAIHITLPNPDDVLVITLEALSENGCTFSVDAPAGRQPFTLTLSTAKTAHFQLTQRAVNQFEVAISAMSHGVLASDGMVSVSAEFSPLPVPPINLPRTLIARYLEGNRQRIRVDTQDLGLMEFQDFLELSVLPEVTLQRLPERMPQLLAESWPQRYDQVTLRLDPQGRVTAIAALYGEDQGRIAQVIPPSTREPFTNGALVLDNGHHYEFSYGTTLDTVAMHGRFCAYETRMIANGLQPGQEIRLSYSPYTEGGTKRRLIHITQPSTVLLHQDYLTMPASSWTTPATASSNLHLGPHIPEPNYLHDVTLQLLRPTKAFVDGWVSYEVFSADPLKLTVVEFAARAFEDSSSVEFLVSDDLVNWTTCGRFDNTWQNSYPQSTNSKAWRNPPQFMDLTPQVQGKIRFFLKMVLRAHPADARFCVESLRVITARHSFSS